MADGLDCSCFGVAPNISANQQQQTLLQPQGLVGNVKNRFDSFVVAAVIEN